MAGEKHLYVTFSGGYDEANDEVESFQIGVRLALVFGTVDDSGTLPSNWDIDPHEDTTTVDDWSVLTTFGVTGPVTETFSPIDYMRDYAIPSLVAGNDAWHLSDHILWKQIKIAPIDNLGHTIDSRTCVALNTTGVAGENSGDMLPLQNAVVVSTRSDAPGPHGRGRFYLPGLTVNHVKVDGDLDDTFIGGIKDGSQALLEGLSFSGGAGPTAHVRPIITGKPYVNYALMSSIKVGNRGDTQRRRRRSLVETYVSQALSFG